MKTIGLKENVLKFEIKKKKINWDFCLPYQIRLLSEVNNSLVFDSKM